MPPLGGQRLPTLPGYYSIPICENFQHQMCKLPFLATSLNIISAVIVLSLSTVQPLFAQAPAPTTLQIVDQKIGNGAVAESGADVMVQYTGYLWQSGLVDNKGKKFDSSFDRSTPFTSFLVVAGLLGVGMKA